LGQLAPLPGNQSGNASGPARWDPIYTLDADGKPVAPETWNDIAAMTVNPTLTADQRGAIEESVRAWLAELQEIVIQNPDLAVEVAKGVFHSADLEDRGELAYVSEIMRTLSATRNLTSFLVNGGVFSNEQGETNRLIVQDYSRAHNEAVTASVQAEEGEDQARQMQMLMARTTMTSMTDDAMRMFRSVAVRGAPHARSALEEAGMDPASFSSQLDAVEQAGSDEAKEKAMIELMDSMETMQLIRFARALNGKLPPVELPQMAKVGTAKAPSENEGG
jgi:hypothetical protein